MKTSTTTRVRKMRRPLRAARVLYLEVKMHLQMARRKYPQALRTYHQIRKVK